MPDNVILIDKGGREIEVPLEDAPQLLDQGFRMRTDADTAARLSSEAREDSYGGVADQVAAGVLGAARGITLGGSDVALSALGGADTARNLREVNPGISTATEIAGGIVGAGKGIGAAGAAAKAGSAVARTAEGASTATKIGRAALGGATEGGLVGVGQGVSELALSADDLNLERAASVLSSNALFGAATGGVVGGAAKGVEIGLTKASKALKDRAAAAAATKQAPEIGEDLAGLDAKGLRTAKEAELAKIEAERVVQRQGVADELAAFRTETKESKLWLATKGAEERELREIGKISLDADRALDRTLRNPKNLASNPKAALAGLQQQEHALELLAKQSDNLRVKYAADTTGERLAVLDKLPAALERNRALQSKIGALVEPPKSARLMAIDDAKDALSMGAREKTLPEQMLAGSVFSAATGAASFLGPLAPLVGAKAAKLVSEKVFGRLGKATSAAAAKSTDVATRFLDVAAKGAAAASRSAPVVASRVLSSVAFGPPAPAPKAPRGTKRPKSPELADSYRARSEELRSQTMYAPDGNVVMRPEARRAMAERLAPIAAADPVLADRLETHAAHRIEYIAAKLPRRPDMGVMQAGPDLWQPSDMEMRTFARVVAAAEDPAAVEERLLDGTLTPEDAECYRELYPERFADLRNQIIGQLSELRATLPYERRLSLSIFTGVPVDPAMHPDVLAVLQNSFAAEEGSEGGMQAPTAQPQFGSVRAEPATASQQREQGA